MISVAFRFSKPEMLGEASTIARSFTHISFIEVDARSESLRTQYDDEFLVFVKTLLDDKLIFNMF